LKIIFLRLYKPLLHEVVHFSSVTGSIFRTKLIMIIYKPDVLCFCNVITVFLAKKQLIKLFEMFYCMFYIGVKLCCQHAHIFFFIWGYMYPFTFIFGGPIYPLTLHFGVQRKWTAFSPHKVVRHAVFYCHHLASVVRPLTFSYFNLLLWNNWAKWNQTWQKASI
jgi:hypothetical protein